jgi:protein disulfide-isomerase
MKKQTYFALVSCLTAALICGCLTSKPTDAPLELPWLTDIQTAQDQAKAQGKLIFVDFEGSDWCTGCIEMHREIFPTKKFAAYADTNLVLMEVDFPENKDLPPELKKKNDAMEKKYNVEGVPTMLLLKADGTEIGRLGYEPGESLDELLAQLEKLRHSAS